VKVSVAGNAQVPERKFAGPKRPFFSALAPEISELPAGNHP
jgi:hypothetical protein